MADAALAPPAGGVVASSDGRTLRDSERARPDRDDPAVSAHTRASLRELPRPRRTPAPSPSSDV